LLREQLKAGTSLDEFNRLRGNFAAEVGMVKDRAEVNSRHGRLLRPYVSAYENALDAYELVGVVWTYHSAMNACRGDEPGHASQPSGLRERIHDLEAEGEWMERIAKCGEGAEATKRVLNQRSAQLNTGCGSDLEYQLDCVVRFAERKADGAGGLLNPR
jgi:hypothetical protein